MFFSENKELEAFISYGKYQQALKLLNSIEKERTLMDDEDLIKLYIQSIIHLDKGMFQKGKTLASELIKKAKEKNNILRELDGINAKIEHLVCLTLFNEAFDLISQGELILSNIQGNFNEEYNYRKAYLLFLKGRTYMNAYKDLEAIELFKKSYEIRSNIDDKFGVLYTLINQGFVTTSIGDFSEAEKFINEALTIAEELDIKNGIVWALLQLGWIKYHLRDLDTAMKSADRCMQICKKESYIYASSICYDLTGHCYFIKGNLNKALSYFQKSLHIRVSSGHKGLVTQSYYSIGNVFSRKGELKKSLEYYEKGLNVSVVEDRVVLKPVYLSIIGKIYGELGDFSTAKKNLLEALDLLIERGIFIYHFQNFSISIAKTYHYLIVLSLNNNDLDKIDEYLNQLYELSIKYKDNKQIKQLYELDKAIILNSKDRLMEKMKAGIIFKKISKEEILDHEISVEAMIHLCDTLIYELELSGDRKILKEIEELSDKLLNIAQSQYLYDLLAETYFLKAKISILNLDIKNSRMLLTKAQTIANEHGLKRLANKISYEHDSFLINLEEWEEKTNQNVSLQERINSSKHEFLFSKMIRTKIEELPKDIEIPVYIVILSTIDGHCLYSNAFEEISLKDGDLIAGFISAINMFGKEAFATSGSIDRIKHGEFLIIFQSKENFLFGYVFKGHSYSAFSKLKDFVQKLYKEEYIIRELTLSANSYTEISDGITSSINQLSTEIFFE